MVVVQEGDTTRHGLDQILLRCWRIAQDEIQSGRGFHFENWGRRSRKQQDQNDACRFQQLAFLRYPRYRSLEDSAATRAPEVISLSEQRPSGSIRALAPELRKRLLHYSCIFGWSVLAQEIFTDSCSGTHRRVIANRANEFLKSVSCPENFQRSIFHRRKLLPKNRFY